MNGKRTATTNGSITTINARMLANPALGNMGGWQERHNAAVTAPKLGFERAIVTLLWGWLEYAAIHKARFGTPVGDDGVLGDPWAEIGRSILTLLNGETGRIDGGTIDGLVRNTLRQNGVEGDE